MMMMFRNQAVANWRVLNNQARQPSSNILGRQRASDFSKSLKPRNIPVNKGRSQICKTSTLLAGSTVAATLLISSMASRQNWSVLSMLGLSQPSVSHCSTAKSVSKSVSLRDLCDPASSLLRAGSPDTTTIAIFYDSKVGTHSEYLAKLEVAEVFERVMQ